MNQHRIRSTTRNITPNSHPQFFIRRSDMAFDERVAYIESVCQALVESRFGPGRVDPVVINLSNRPEREESVFYDLLDYEMVPSYSVSLQGHPGFQVVIKERSRWDL